MKEVQYDAGDEVLLGGDAREIASLANCALRGVVVARHTDDPETSYTVRFPGRIGAVRLPAGALLPAGPFEVIRLGSRYTAATLSEAVGVLVEVAARIGRCRADGAAPSALDLLDCRTIAAAIEQRCHMMPGQIADQIAPEVADVVRAGHLPHPARLDMVLAPVPNTVPYAAPRRTASAGRIRRSRRAGAR